MQAPITSAAHGTAWPTAGLLAAALISGLYWLPLQKVEQAGIAGLWAPLSIAVVASTPLLLPILRWHRRTYADWRNLTLIGLLLGGAYALYAASFMLTEVVRVVLLFYLAPVWGTLLEIFVLRRSLTLQRCASLILGLGGLAVILGADRGLALAVNAGDALALASGVAWSIGLLVVFSRHQRPIGEQIAAQAGGAMFVAVLVALAGLPVAALPPAGDFIAALPWLLVTALLTIPLWCLSLWASRHLAPARTTLLFMVEVCIGVGSAALFSGDPFGWREAIGTVLVVAAALVELRRPSRRPADAEPAAADLV